MNNIPRYTGQSPEIREAKAKSYAAYDRFKAYANGPERDPATMLRMQRELEEMINSCPSWRVTGKEYKAGTVWTLET
jgi:hypothetical protein